MRRSYRVLIALAGGAVLGLAAHASAKRGLADWTSMRDRHEIAAWAERRASPPPARLQESITSLIDALELTPQNPTLIEHLGVALELRASASPPGSDMRRLALGASLSYLRKAAALRPSSPYTWANILLAKYRLGQIDAEFARALRNALALGPWEPAVQIIVADAALGSWDRLDSDLRARARANLQRAALRQSGALARLASDPRRTQLLCAALLDKLQNRVKCVK